MKAALFIPLVMLLVASCVSSSAYHSSCPKIEIHNAGYETVRIIGGGRRLATVQSNETITRPLCGINRINYVTVQAIGGRYEFSVHRTNSTFLHPDELIILHVHERRHYSYWLKQ